MWALLVAIGSTRTSNSLLDPFSINSLFLHSGVRGHVEICSVTRNHPCLPPSLTYSLLLFWFTVFLFYFFIATYSYDSPLVVTPETENLQLPALKSPLCCWDFPSLSTNITDSFYIKVSSKTSQCKSLHGFSTAFYVFWTHICLLDCNSQNMPTQHQWSMFMSSYGPICIWFRNINW